MTVGVGGGSAPSHAARGPQRGPQGGPQVGTDLLDVRDLAVSLGGQVVVDGVSLAFQHGSLVAIVGPNGAGKTTFFNLLSGQLRPDRGTVHLAGVDITALGMPERAQRGLGRVFQMNQLFSALTVIENVALALTARQGRAASLWQRADRRPDMRARGMACLEQVQLAGLASQPVHALPHGARRKLEMALLLAQDPVVCLLDEPTAGMAVEEVPAMLDLVAQLHQRADRVILLIEHKMDVVRSLAQRIIVLHQGRVLADGSPGSVMDSADVQAVYLGGPPA